MRQALLIAASATALLSAPALAQSGGEIRLGQEISGRVEQGAADYRIMLREGQRLLAEMRSSDMDAYLEIYAEGDRDTVLAWDDDGLGQGTDARLRFTAPADGLYVLRARGVHDAEGGRFTLAARERPTPRDLRPQRLSIGRSAQGSLAEGDAEDEQGELFDAYVLRLSAGQRVAVWLESDDFDPLLRIGLSEGGAFRQVAENDDGAGEGLNSHLVFTAAQTGDHVIRAASVGSGAGAYSLRVEEGPPAPLARGIGIGDVVQGELGPDSDLGESGGRTDLYRLTGRAGQRLAISMTAEDFDSHLELHDADRNSLASDDDGGGGLNARLVYTLPEDGDYLIEARAFSEGEGEYELKVEEVQPPPPPVQAIFGQAVSGELDEEDGRDDEGRLFDGYVFSGEEGRRVQAVLRSGDFDALLELGRGGETFEVLARDDDGLGQGTDARLTFTLPEDGEYVVRVSPYEADGMGLYSLEMIDRGPEPEPGSILIGATARGVLDERDSLTDAGSYFDAYRFRAKTEEKLRFTMVAAEFDAVIEVGEEKDGEFDSLAEDDDGLSDTHARLDWAAPKDGFYVVRARSFAPNATGAYVLLVERRP